MAIADRSLYLFIAANWWCPAFFCSSAGLSHIRWSDVRYAFLTHSCIVLQLAFFFFLLTSGNVYHLHIIFVGGNIFPVEEPSVPLGEVEKLRKQFQSDMDILSTRLETLVKSNANQSDSISWSEIEKLRRQLQADLEDFSTRMDSLKKVHILTMTLNVT